MMKRLDGNGEPLYNVSIFLNKDTDKFNKFCLVNTHGHPCRRIGPRPPPPSLRDLARGASLKMICSKDFFSDPTIGSIFSKQELELWMKSTLKNGSPQVLLRNMTWL